MNRIEDEFSIDSGEKKVVFVKKSVHLDRKAKEANKDKKPVDTTGTPIPEGSVPPVVQSEPIQTITKPK